MAAASRPRRLVACAGAALLLCACLPAASVALAVGDQIAATLTLPPDTTNLFPSASQAVEDPSDYENWIGTVFDNLPEVNQLAFRLQIAEGGASFIAVANNSPYNLTIASPYTATATIAPPTSSSKAFVSASSQDVNRPGISQLHATVTLVDGSTISITIPAGTYTSYMTYATEILFTTGTPPEPSPALEPSPSPALEPSPSPALEPSPSPALECTPPASPSTPTCCALDGSFKPAGTVCDPATSVCERSSVCGGVSQHCPKKQRVPKDTPCSAATKPCERPGVCSSKGVCGPTTVAPRFTVCRRADAPCDATEVCDGRSLECPADRDAADGTPCAWDANGRPGPWCFKDKSSTPRLWDPTGAACRGQGIGRCVATCEDGVCVMRAKSKHHCTGEGNHCHHWK